jgi:hypothetical protein
MTGLGPSLCVLGGLSHGLASHNILVGGNARETL